MKPPTWNSEPLGNLCDLITDGKHGDCTDEADSGFYFISAKDIRDGQICYEGARQIAESDFAETHRRTDLTPGDILLTNSGTIGRLAIAGDDDVTRRTTFQKSVAILKPTENRVVSRFLYYFLAGNTTTLENAARGAAQKNLLLGELRRFSVITPPVGVQIKIAQVLSAYDDLIENNRRRMALLEESARLLYREWFVRLRFPGHEHTRITNGVPEGWEQESLGDLCQEIRDQIEPVEIERGTPYIGLEHMPRRSITLSTWDSADDVASTKHRFRAGDVLFGKIRPYFHKVGIALTDGVASSDAIVLRPINQQAAMLVLTTASSDLFVRTVSQTVREGSKMPRADAKLMLRFPVNVPPHPLLETFNVTLTPMVAQLRVLVLQNRKLCEARDLLLPRLMNGEVKV